MGPNVAFALAAIVVVSLSSATKADPYDNPTSPSPPPSAVAGKEFPQSVACNDPSTKCFGKEIACPSQCPSFKPSDPSSKACSIDWDGIIFYFHGKSNEHFTLVSDQHFQINAGFIGRRPEGRKRDNTWIQSLGLMFGSHTFAFGAKKVANWDDTVDQFHFSYDGNLINIAPGHLSTWTGPDSQLIIERTADTNVIIVTLPDVVEMSARVVPITEDDDRVHNYQVRYGEDCFAHLEMQFRFFDLSEAVEGVLGQTYRPEFESPVKRGVAMPVMGGENKYLTSSLVSADCRFCIFSPEKAPGKALELKEVNNAVECSSRISGGRGVACRR
ncbi:hypothetical protein LINPERHAP2_LOCUS45378 [Linum perenne]